MEIVSEPAANQFTLYVTPGCSNCLRTKEFLAKRGVNFTLIDVENDARGREKLRELGVRHAPVLFKGDSWILSKNLDVVAKFLGVHALEHTPLPPEEIFKKWIAVLRAAQRYIRQLPSDLAGKKALNIRDRSIQILSYHIFSLVEAYLECVEHGAQNLNELQKKFQILEPGTFTTGEEIVQYGEKIINRLENWWRTLEDKSCRQRIEIIFYGNISLHQLLDRGAWHSAHHTRQIGDVLEQLGIAPDGKLTAQDLAGMPLPKEIWD